MSNSRSFAMFLFLLSFITLTGCATPTLHSLTPLPNGLAVVTVGKVDRSGPLAVNRAGAIATLAGEKVQLFRAPDQPGQEVAAGVATELAFSPAGDRLAASFFDKTNKPRSVLRIYDLKGKILGETTITGRITSLDWRSEKELLATGLEIKRFSFGTELVGSLYRWDTVNAPQPIPLSDVTIRPQLGKLPEDILYQSLMMTVSPYRDEIVYTAFRDPPMFTPYLEVRLRHLDTGAQRVVAEVGIGSGKPHYTPDGESLVVSDARALARQIVIPGGKEVNAWPAPGDHADLSPSGKFLFLDGRLYQGGNEIASFPKEANGVFLPDGSGLAISCDGGLFLLAGLNDARPPALSADLGKLLELRRLRMLNLITESEFQARKNKVNAQ